MTPATGTRRVAELLARAASRDCVVAADGRSGAVYERVTADGTACFVKRLSPASDWVMRVTGDQVHRAYLAWQAGIMDRVWPTPTAINFHASELSWLHGICAPTVGPVSSVARVSAPP